MLPALRRLSVYPFTLNSQLPNSDLGTLHRKTLYLKFLGLDPNPYTLNPQPSTLNPKP